MRREIVERNEPATGWDMADLAAGMVPPLGETPAKWALTTAQHYIVDILFLSDYVIWA